MINLLGCTDCFIHECFLSYNISIVSTYNRFIQSDSLKILPLVLSRKFLSMFMVTYLPTILMNMINQVTNYINGDTRYDLVFTINITCMMVLASVYLSVSVSLPSTSDIKPVEIWLLFNLAYPFLVIFVNVLLQVLSLLLHCLTAGIKLRNIN